MKFLTVPICLLSLSSSLFAQGEVAVTMKTLAAQMKYDLPEFIVPPGAKVKLTLINDDEMPHNLVVTKPADDKGMALAQTAWALGEKGMEMHWVPNDPRVLAATKTIAPHAKEELVFTAPTEPGSYPYVCTFPGHAAAMNGVMQVRPGGANVAGPKLTDGKYQLFLGKWEMLPDFGQLKPLREGPLEDNLIGWKFDDYKNEFGIRFTGNLEVKKEGDYTFRLASDDGSRVRLNGPTILAQDGIHPPGSGKTTTVRLKPGKQTLQLDYFQGGAGAELYLSWSGPDFGETWLTKMKLDVPSKKAKSQSSQTGIPLVVKDEAIIYRNFIAGVGARGIAVGLPGGVNAAFDAELCNVALVWRGAFMDAKRHWTDRGVGPQPPLGYAVVALDKNVPLAVLPAADAQWPAAPKDLPWGDWPTGYKFGGYRLDKKGIPTFRYSYAGIEVEDRMEAAPASSSHAGHTGATLKRVVTLRASKAPAELHFRLASGKPVAAGKNGVFPLNEGVSLNAAGAIVRGTDLLVPVTFKDGVARVEVSYVWNH